MAVVWTEQLKAKAKATREANKAKKEARLAKKLERQNAQADDNSGSASGETEAVTPEGQNAETLSQLQVGVLPQCDYDWEEAPLHEAQQKAADMKREYERIAAIIVRRQNPAMQAWTCWTQEHKNDKDDKGEYVIPASVRKQCLRHGPDGKWKFRDDGRFVMENGVRTLRPAFCCNYLCAEVYNRFRTQAKMRGVTY